MESLTSAHETKKKNIGSEQLFVDYTKCCPMRETKTNLQYTEGTNEVSASASIPSVLAIYVRTSFEY